MSEIKPVDFGVLILRVALGVILAAHGLQKVLGIWGGPGIEGFSGFVKSLDFHPPVFWAWAAAISETIGGFFLILGVVPRTSAFLVSVTMMVAIFKVHWNGLFMSDNGFEYPLLILAACLSILVSGSGKLSVFNKF